jgi:hypothetical protein
VAILQSGGNTAVTEGGATDSYTVALTSQPSANVLITLTGTQVTTAATSFLLIFTNANWNVPQSVTVTAIDDNVVEGAHTGTVALAVTSTDTNYSNLVVPAVSVAITDNDSATVSLNPTSVSQSEASSPMAFTVTLSNPVASGVTLTVNTAVGTAALADFTAITNGTVTFAPNNTVAQTVNVVINNDLLDENDENFTLTLSNLVATGTVTIDTATATGTIQDDDALPVLSMANVSIPEGIAGTSAMNFVVNLTPVSGRDVSFTRATADGTATTANNDYVALAAGSITIPAGQSSVTIPVTINGDTVFEGNETLSLNLTAAVNATPITLSAIGTIIDDDQQPTTTTIVSDGPDPTVTGQSYAVNVSVTAQSTSPLGTVNVSDGAAGCVVTLAATTSPNSSGTCNLSSTTAGAKTLTATYVSASTAFAASSAATATHQVNAASTMLSFSVPPARSRINQPTSFAIAVAIVAPGSGAPAGVVTLTSGTSSCVVNLPTATPTCNLIFSNLGPRVVNASFVPSDGNFLGSSTTTPASTLVYAQADVAVTKSDGVSSYRDGDLLVYSINVRNNGPDFAPNVRVGDTVPTSLLSPSWTCSASGGAFCPQSGGFGDINATIGVFPANGALNYTLSANVPRPAPQQIANRAEVFLPADNTIEDLITGNQGQTDTDLLDFLLADGFEGATVLATNGTYVVQGNALRSVSDSVARVDYNLRDRSGEVLRIYARQIDGTLEFALAIRGNNGQWTLQGWQQFATDPRLTWTATATANGFVLNTAVLQ